MKNISYADFCKSLKSGKAPEALSSALQALWHDARGEWDAAHQLVQSAQDGNDAWVHAYLHRKEGDVGNARYWYSQAGRTKPNAALAQEWQSIVEALLEED